MSSIGWLLSFVCALAMVTTDGIAVPLMVVAGAISLAATGAWKVKGALDEVNARLGSLEARTEKLPCVVEAAAKCRGPKE